MFLLTFLLKLISSLVKTDFFFSQLWDKLQQQILWYFVKYVDLCFASCPGPQGAALKDLHAAPPGGDSVIAAAFFPAFFQLSFKEFYKTSEFRIISSFIHSHPLNF